jgi:hypothetical protein
MFDPARRASQSRRILSRNHKEFPIMYNVTVTLAKTDTPLATGIVFGHTNLTSTDSAGAVQNFSLNGSETPPWTVTVAGLADGASSFVAQDVDSNGVAIGAAVTGSYTPVAVTFPATSGISFTPA